MPTNRQPSDQRERTIQLQNRTFEFAKRVLNLCPRRYVDDPSRVIWRQLIRAAPSSSGILEEADEASSTREFIYRMKIVLREMRESKRWLLFIGHCKLQQHQRLGDLPDEARQLASIFAAIVRNTQRRVAEQAAAGQRTRPSAPKPTQQS
jgi:four helix bundle protein